MSVDEVPVILDLIKRLKRRATRPSSCRPRWTWCARRRRIVVLHNGRLVADGSPPR